MKYPNAYKGLGKVLAAQILEVIGVILLIVGSLLAITAANMPALDMGIAGPAIGLFFAGAIIAIVAYILNIVGFNQARKDEKQFLISMILIFVAIAAAIISAVTQGTNASLADWLSFVALIFELAAFESSADGIRSLANNIGDEKIAKTALALKIFITIIWVITLVLRIFDNITPEVGEVLYLIAGIVQLVAFIVYIVLLTKARKMLAKAE